MGGLIVGRSSAITLGLLVEPGIIDADSQSEIFVLVHTDYPPVKIPAGQRLAQLVPLPQLTSTISPLSTGPRKSTGSSSTGPLTLLTIDLSSRPRKHCLLQYQNESITLEGLLDTGADSSVIDAKKWPSNWPILPATTAVTGIGGMRLAQKSPLIKIRIDSKQVTATFSITSLPATVDCLLGRDILAQLGLVLTNDHHLH